MQAEVSPLDLLPWWSRYHAAIPLCLPCSFPYASPGDHWGDYEAEPDGGASLVGHQVTDAAVAAHHWGCSTALHHQAGLPPHSSGLSFSCSLATAWSFFREISVPYEIWLKWKMKIGDWCWGISQMRSTTTWCWYSQSCLWLRWTLEQRVSYCLDALWEEIGINLHNILQFSMMKIEQSLLDPSWLWLSNWLAETCQI